MVAASKSAAPAVEAPPGFWQRETSHYPKPLAPLGASFLLTGINQSFRKVFEEVGLPIEGLEFREIGGYVYQRMKPLGTGDSAPRKLPPKFVLWLAVRLHPAFRRRAARCKQVVNGRVDREYVERWYDEWRPQLVRDIERLRGVDLPVMTDEQLAAHLDELWRWVAANEALADADDVFFLRFEELSDVVRSRQAAYKKFVEQRREERAMAEAFDPPAVYGEEPPPPPLDVFPPETRQLMEGLLYVTEKVFEPELSNRREDSGAREIQGIAAGCGTYTGPARVISGEDEFSKLQSGDVLVCPITSPVWSILFAKVGALVTDSGGVLSHPAIIAREYGIPAVVATGNATEIIRDGQQLAVDGDAGVVRLLG